MDLTGLPQFTIESIRSADGHEDSVLRGRLSHLTGVRNCRGHLYRESGRSIVGTLSRVPDNPSDFLEFATPDLELALDVRVGSVLPWIDGYWEPYHVTMVLAGRWERRAFRAGPARYFRNGTVTGWQPADAPLPELAQDLGVRDGSWDHEHCELCNVQVGGTGAMIGYVDPDERWLCQACFARYAVPRDVSFAAEA